MSVSKGRSSDVLRELFGDIRKYTRIMDKYSRILQSKYLNKELSSVFAGLSTHIITIMPMAMCDLLAKDLGIKVTENQLASIGLSCLLISTHDDVVDELPRHRRTVASLIYGGNIAGIAGVQLLLKEKNFAFSAVLLQAISDNHYLQQEVVEKLWEGRPINLKKYLDGVKHITVFTAIGPVCAVALSNKKHLQKRILKFSNGYGIALQLIDDLREIEEDKQAGYSSLPLYEGAPYKASLRELFAGIDTARKSLDPKWVRMNAIVDNIEDFANKLKKEMNA